ncbi:hypothetical protein BU26DRAFT_390664, partial [Trematosphaeria pertusa]
SNMRPPFLYRVFYETSATLSSYVSKHTHVKHREQPKLKLREGNAFQAISKFSAARDLTRVRMERHLRWQQKRDPSSYISAFNCIRYAVRRAEFHSNHSQRIGQRISVAKISTSGLIAATVRGTLEETVLTTWKDSLLGKTESVTVTTRDVQIPAWVHESAIPDDAAAISVEQLATSGAVMWLSITELRLSNLKVPATKGHDYEWLACGAIPKSNIIRIMPFDGTTLHQEQGPKVVRSLRSREPWVFDWQQQMWILRA